jgi:hypothetical protein
MCIDSYGELPNVTTLKIGAKDEERAAPFTFYFFPSLLALYAFKLKLFCFMGMAYPL